MTSNDAKPAIGATDCGRGYASDVYVDRVVFRRVIGIDLGNHRREIFPVDIAGSIEYFQRRASERGLASGVEDVASKTDMKFLHRCLHASSGASER